MAQKCQQSTAYILKVIDLMGTSERKQEKLFWSIHQEASKPRSMRFLWYLKTTKGQTFVAFKSFKRSELILVQNKPRRYDHENKTLKKISGLQTEKCTFINVPSINAKFQPQILENLSMWSQKKKTYHNRSLPDRKVYNHLFSLDKCQMQMTYLSSLDVLNGQV